MTIKYTRPQDITLSLQKPLRCPVLQTIKTETEGMIRKGEGNSEGSKAGERFKKQMDGAAVCVCYRDKKQ